MSKGKKILAVLLTVIMTVAMTVTAFAEGTQNRTITISGIGFEGSTLPEVKYGQIIEPDTESTLGWKFKGGNNTDIANAFISAWNGATNPVGDLDAKGVIKALIGLGCLENVNHVDTEDVIPNYNVEHGIINSSEAFGAALEAVKTYATIDMDVTTGAENVATGLYIVTAQKEGYTYLPMAAYMSTAGDDVVITAKGSTDQINKTVAKDGKSVAPGDEVEYTITQQYLYFAPNTVEKTFTITDTLTNGTFKADSVKIEIGDTDAVKDRDYTITDYANGKTFTVDFGAKYNSAYAGKTVEIKYTAIAGAVTASAPLTNNVASSNKKGKIVKTKTVSFEVTKVEKGDNEDQTKVLSGAKFQIYKEVDQNTANAKELTLEDGKEVYGLAVGGEITTDANGKASVNNLDAQVTYYVKETQAPAGYSLNDTAYELKGAAAMSDTTETITENGVTYTVVTHNFSNFDDQTITDTKLANLPSTGGIGTTIFTAAGCLIMICAAVFLFASRRRFSK